MLIEEWARNAEPRDVFCFMIDDPCGLVAKDNPAGRFGASLVHCGMARITQTLGKDGRWRVKLERTSVPYDRDVVVRSMEIIAPLFDGKHGRVCVKCGREFIARFQRQKKCASCA